MSQDSKKLSQDSQKLCMDYSVEIINIATSGAPDICEKLDELVKKFQNDDLLSKEQKETLLKNMESIKAQIKVEYYN